MTPLEYAEQIAYSTKETLHFTYDCAKKLKDLPGCYVECGVAAGAQIIAMACAAPNKTIYAFDSFQGIPLPSNKDDQMPGIRMLTFDEQRTLPDPGEQKLESSGATSVSMDDYMDHIHMSGVLPHEIISIKGWFENTVVGFDKPIALLRLDGDLYNSTYVCLKHLYPKVVKGGMIIIDDWALPGCRQAVIDYLGENEIDILYQILESGDSQIAYWTK